MTDVVTPEPMTALITTEPPFAPVPYYFAADDGWYANVPTLFGIAHIPHSKWPATLPDINPEFVYSDEMVPRHILTQALDFFRKVYSAHHTEATTYICRDSEGAYSLFIPQQYVTGASVSHKVEPGEMGQRYPVGTIHSHCMMSAFHSGTDQHDMGKMPGLHITIGMVMADTPEYAVALAVGDTRFDITTEEIIDEERTKDANGYDTAPDHWLTFVHPNENPPWQKAITTTYRKPGLGNTNYSHGEWAGGWRGAWDNDTYWTSYKPKPTAPDDPEAEIALEEAENDLATLSIDLAEAGFRLQYTITFDPAMAKAWLDNIDGKKTTAALFGEE